VRRHLVDVVVLSAGATIALASVILTEPSLRTPALRVYLLVLGTLLMLVVVAAGAEALPRRRRSEFDRALARVEEPRGPLAEFARVEREVTLAIATSYDLHHRLLPQLREIASCRLERSGRTPSPETLGRWWELLRPDREEPEERFAPGIPERELRALVADLEAL
jgi:hypothetical protein